MTKKDPDGIGLTGRANVTTEDITIGEVEWYNSDEFNATHEAHAPTWWGRTRYKLAKFREKSIQWMINMIIYITKAVWRLVTIPMKIFEAIFYAHKLDDNGRTIGSKFSLIKMIFSLTSFIMMFKLFIGGADFEDFKFGPDVEVHSKVIKRKVKVRKRKRRKRVKKSKLKKKPLIKIKSTNTITTTRPFIYIKKYVGHPMTGMEILFYLIIAGLFYFRDDFSQGDQRGVFGTLVDTLIHAKAMQMSGGALAPQPMHEAHAQPTGPPTITKAEEKEIETETKVVKDAFD